VFNSKQIAARKKNEKVRIHREKKHQVTNNIKTLQSDDLLEKNNVEKKNSWNQIN